MASVSLVQSSFCLCSENWRVTAPFLRSYWLLVFHVFKHTISCGQNGNCTHKKGEKCEIIKIHIFLLFYVSVILTVPDVPSPRPSPADDGGWWRAPAAWWTFPQHTTVSLFPASRPSPLQTLITTSPPFGPKWGPQKTSLRTTESGQKQKKWDLLA